jgi:hypothetical protein
MIYTRLLCLYIHKYCRISWSASRCSPEGGSGWWQGSWSMSIRGWGIVWCSFWETECTPNRGRSFPHWLASIVLTQQLPTEGGTARSRRLTCRGKPRMGGLSVEKTFERQVTAGEASKERAAETRRRRRKSLIQSKGGVWQYMSWVYTATSWTYTCIYPFFASHCLKSDLSNSDSSISCNVYGICIFANSSIRNLPKGMKKTDLQ